MQVHIQSQSKSKKGPEVEMKNTSLMKCVIKADKPKLRFLVKFYLMKNFNYA